ncbi:MAG TPA: WecB/TagA/CpsF family glycosyltransferase [Chthoniobacterales bacterium]
MKTITYRLLKFTNRNSVSSLRLEPKAPERRISRPARTTPLLGIKFFAGTFDEAIDKLAHGGGLSVFPSGPGIAQDMRKSEAYRQALQQADLAFGDSGAMVLLWRMLTGGRIPRYSGLRVLQAVIKHEEFRKPEATFWVMPSADQMEHNLNWLNKSEGILVDQDACHIAPQYSSEGFLEDPDLVARIEKARPKFVVLCIGGGVQERLGLHLRNSLSYRPTILCIGAAIGFLTGVQAHIPTWADRAKLGWLVRCIDNPKVFVPRYLGALSLVQVLAQHWFSGKIPGPVKEEFSDEAIGEMSEA